MNRCLVTGSSGFIGSKLFQFLSQKPEIDILIGCNRSSEILPYSIPNSSEVREHYYCDLTKPDEVKNLLDCVRPNIIFHLAANPIVKPDRLNPFDLQHSNYLATHYLLEHCRTDTKFIFTSSILVYKHYNEPCLETFDTSPSSIYGLTKLASEQLIRLYTERELIEGKVLRLGATIGYGMTHGLIPDLIRKLKIEGPDLTLLSNSMKPFTHVDDVVTGLNLMLHSINKKFEVYNCCVDDAVPVNEIAEIAMDELNIKKNVIFTESWPGDNNYLTIYNHRIKCKGLVFKYPTSRQSIRQCIKEIKNDTI